MHRFVWANPNPGQGETIGCGSAAPIFPPANLIASLPDHLDHQDFIFHAA
jgi:hypothetical protein